MSRAIANQLFVAFLGRSVDNQWLSATGNLIASAPSIHTTLGMQQLLYSIAVSEGVYVPSDAAGVYVNKIFQNVFGFAASTQEQTAWGTLINNRTIATEAAPWVIFSSYLGSATVPQTYKFAAQYRLVLAESYTNGLTAADNIALASTASGIDAVLMPVALLAAIRRGTRWLEWRAARAPRRARRIHHLPLALPVNPSPKLSCVLRVRRTKEPHGQALCIY
jgi:hypothetical protein